MGLSAHHAGIGIHTEEGVLAHRFTPSWPLKTSGVRTLMSRAGAPFSNGTECVAKVKTIVDTLKENGYPLRFTHRHSHSKDQPDPAYSNGCLSETSSHAALCNHMHGVSLRAGTFSATSTFWSWREEPIPEDTQLYWTSMHSIYIYRLHTTYSTSHWTWMH